MKASTLINRIEELVKEYGDLDIGMYENMKAGYCYQDIFTVRLKKKKEKDVKHLGNTFIGIS